MKKQSLLAGMIVLGAFTAVPALATEELDALKTSSGSQVRFALNGALSNGTSSYSNATLTITGPDGFVATSFSKAGSPSIDLREARDGIYTYQLNAATSDTVNVTNDLDNGRDAERKTMQVGASSSGTLLVKDGVIVDTSGVREEAR